MKKINGVETKKIIWSSFLKLNQYLTSLYFKVYIAKKKNKFFKIISSYIILQIHKIVPIKQPDFLPANNFKWSYLWSLDKIKF